jgi:hypothetical protein
MKQLLLSGETIARNYLALTKKLGHPLMPMVKAGGYGTSALLLAKLYEKLGAPL